MGAILIDDSLKEAPTNVESPLVSIEVEAYNHEGYIERCLKSIAMQKVDFDVEVLVGEDHSPDSTAEVLRRIAPELPDWFTIILRKRNLGGTGNGRDLWRRMRGKYAAFVEGDDFWTDPGKLQRQVDFLESHPEYSACYAKVYVVGEDSKPNGEKYPQCRLSDYTLREFFYSTLPGHWSTLMCRWPEFYGAYSDYISQDNCAPYAGDRRNALILLSLGKIRCMDEVTGAYRHVKNKGTSYSATTTINEKYARNEILYGESLVEFAQGHGDAAMVEIARRTYYRFMLKWSVGKVKVRKLSETLGEIMRQPRWYAYLFAPLQWYAVLGSRMLRGIPIDM